MHKLIQATLAFALVIAVSIHETECSQRVVDRYQRQLNNLQKKINTGKPVVVNGKIKRYKCIEEYVSVDEYGNVVDTTESKSDVSPVKPRKITTTTLAPSTTTNTTKERTTDKLTIQHIPNTNSAEEVDDSESSAHKTALSMVQSSANEKVEKVPNSKVNDNEDDGTGTVPRRKESRRFGMNRGAAKSVEDEQYDEYDDEYYVEERPVLRRSHNRGFYRRRPAYYVPYETDVYGKRRVPMRRAYAGNFINDDQDEFVERQEMSQRVPVFQGRQVVAQAPVQPNIANQQMPTPQPLPAFARNGFTPVQRATQPPLAQPALFSYMTNRRPLMPTTPKSASFLQGNGIDDGDSTTPKPNIATAFMPSQQNCQGIANMAKQYGVTDVQGFIRHNCGLIQTLTLIQAPCDVIFNFVDQCYKRKLL